MKKTGCLGYIGDEILPSYIGIISQTILRILIIQPVYWKVVRVFFVAQLINRTAGGSPQIVVVS